VGHGLNVFLNYGFRGGYGGWQDQPAGRTLDDIALHSARAGLEAERWSLIASAENLYDNFYVSQRVSPASVRASEPRTWKITATIRY
jgi:hypothetical protein